LIGVPPFDVNDLATQRHRLRRAGRRATLRHANDLAKHEMLFDDEDHLLEYWDHKHADATTCLA
jgi:hypothetical protein